MAFLAPRFYRLPSWMGYDESLQASRSIGDRGVLILWKMVARVPPTGATPNVAVARQEVVLRVHGIGCRLILLGHGSCVVVVGLSSAGLSFFGFDLYSHWLHWRLSEPWDI